MVSTWRSDAGRDGNPDRRRAGLKAPRAGAIAGILFSILLIIHKLEDVGLRDHLYQHTAHRFQIVI